MKSEEREGRLSKNLSDHDYIRNPTHNKPEIVEEVCIFSCLREDFFQHRPEPSD